MSRASFGRIVRVGTALAVLIIITAPRLATATDFNWSTGNYLPGGTAPQPLPLGDGLEINAGGNKFFNGVTFTNQGGFVKWNADSLFFLNGAVVNNQAEWDAKSDNSLVNNGGLLSTFN